MSGRVYHLSASVQNFEWEKYQNHDAVSLRMLDRKHTRSGRGFFFVSPSEGKIQRNLCQAGNELI